MASDKQYYFQFVIADRPLEVYYSGSVCCPCNICPELVNDDNYKAWQTVIRMEIAKLMTSKTMRSKEFQKALADFEKEKRYALREAQRRKEKDEQRQRRRSMQSPGIDAIPKGLYVDYEQHYGVFLQQEVTFKPTVPEDFEYQLKLIERWYKQSVPRMIAKGRPDAAYAVSTVLCRALPRFVFRDDIREYLDYDKRRIEALIVGAFGALAKSVMAWNDNDKRLAANVFIIEQADAYEGYPALHRAILDCVQSENFTGEPMTIKRERRYGEISEERQQEIERERRMEAEREARSVIPLNHDYETRIFTYKNIDWECDTIWRMMLAESTRIEGLALGGNYNDAALLFMQLTKSMCRHFIKDEHFNLFDDVYSPEQVIGDLVRFFNKLSADGKLPKETQDYLRAAWPEILSTEASRSYGLLISYSFTF